MGNPNRGGGEGGDCNQRLQRYEPIRAPSLRHITQKRASFLFLLNEFGKFDSVAECESLTGVVVDSVGGCAAADPEAGELSASQGSAVGGVGVANLVSRLPDGKI